MSGLVTATVVIPARDAEASIGHCVRSVRDQTDADGCGVRVLVVDDGSIDGTAGVAVAAGAQVLSADGDGPARARNLGVEAATTPLVIFTDADCAPCEGFVRALLAPFADPRVAGTKGAYVTEQRSWVARFVQIEYEERYARMARRESIDFIDTYAAAYRRQVLDEVGGFDERYKVPSTEDQELSFRVSAAGGRLLFVPAARVAHVHADTLWGYARKKAKIGTFKVATLRRHADKAVSDAHTPATLKLQLVLAPLALVGLGVGLAAPGPGGGLTGVWIFGVGASLAFLVSALPLWLRALRHDPAVGVVAPVLILVRALALGYGVLRGVARELVGGGVLAPGEST